MTVHLEITRKNSKCSTDEPVKEIVEWKRPSDRFLLFCAFALLCAGTCDTLIAKLMNKQSFPNPKTKEIQYFEAPMWQTFISYIIEASMILVYWHDRRKAKKSQKDFHSEYVHLHTAAVSFVKPSCPFWWWAIPSFLDFLTSIGVNYAFIYLYASTAQLLRNFNIIITAILSLLYVKVALRKHQIMGVLVVTLGLIITGIQEFVNPDSNTNYDSPYVGVIMALGGTIANALQVVVEERLFRDYHASPCEALGYFGIFGLIFSLISFLIMEFVPSSSEKLSRIFEVMSEGTYDAHMVIATSCIMLCSIAIFNLSGMTVTKLGSCLLRMIVISGRTVTIWLIELIVGWNSFKGWNFAGLVVTILGVVLYNYNYCCRKDCWKGDMWLRDPVMFKDKWKHPDQVEEDKLRLPSFIQYYTPDQGKIHS